MIREDVHDRLKEIYDEFDRHCRINGVDYSIDADYCNVQGYRLLDGTQARGVLCHIANYVKDKPVRLEYNGHSVNYDDVKADRIVVSTYNPLFKFTLESIQEGKMLNEDQYKGPTNAHGRRQAAFPSSSRNLKTRDTYENEGDRKKKKEEKKEDEKKEESIHPDTFEDRLLDSINENVGLSFKDPDILLTKNNANVEDEDELEVEEALKTESAMLDKYLLALEKSEDELTTVVLEGMVERCTAQINSLNGLLKERDGTDRT